MSFTGLAFLVLYVGALLFAFYRPVYGLYAYVWTFYASPGTAWWGQDLPNLRWSLAAALVTLVASLLSDTRPKSGQEVFDPRPSVSSDPTVWLMALLALWTWCQVLWAVSWTQQLDGAIFFSKFLVLYVLIRRLLTDRTSIGLFALSHVFGAFTWGWYAFRSDVQGRFEPNLGPAMDDANAIGFQIVTAVAFAGFMFVGLRGWKRWATFGTLPFLLNTIILTASRSAFLGLAAAGAVALPMAPKRHRRLVYASAALGVILFLRLAGSEVFWDRAATLRQVEVEQLDASAASRIDVARANWRMFLDYPMGAGWRGNAILSPQYLPPEMLAEGGQRSAHNTVLAALVDFGMPGALLFLLVTVRALVTVVRIRRLAWQSSDMALAMYVAATASSLVAFCVSAQFINLLPVEVWVWLIGLVASLNTLLGQASEVGETQLYPVAQGSVPLSLQHFPADPASTRPRP